MLVRLATSGAGADLPLSVKFGSPEADLPGLLLLANALGLEAAGVAFHVGSQQRDPGRWELPIAQAARVFTATRKAGLRPYLLDIGGGLPARHEGVCPGLPTYAGIIAAALDRHFGGERPEVIVEPGRGIVGDAGTLVAEIIGITWRDGRRWVTVDAGVFSGLVEALGEEIRYRLSTDRDGDPSGPAEPAGPTCDSVDLL